MQDDIDELQDEIDELEEKLKNPAIVAGTGQLSGWIDTLKDVKEIFPGIGNLFGNVNGLPQDAELDNIIAELKMIDPLFKEQLKSYLQQYKQALENGSNNNPANGQA